jgi:NADH:ubiquinone oxidoreductase subunit 2 (subunit N)
MPISEFILGGAAVAQGLLLIVSYRMFSRRLIEFLSVAGFLSAAVALLVNQSGVQLFSAGMLEDQPLFRIPRAALFLASLLLSRSIVSTRELPEGRKPEVLFLLSSLVLLCDLLILSRHETLSCILLVVSSWVGIFLGGLAYRGRMEGEAVLKYWMQASLTLSVGFGAAVLLSLVAGGAHHEVLSAYLKTQDPYAPASLLVVACVFLPYFIAGGLFPFHFIAVDRDHGTPWSVQTVYSIVVQGSVAVAAWKTGVTVFGHTQRPDVSEGLRVLQLCGLFGGFWLALFALAQENSKRLYSALVGSQWSAILAAGALPSVLSGTAMIYALSASFIWSSVLGFVWSRFQEWAGGDLLSDVYGVAKEFRTSGLILILALASPLCVPGFPGFPSVLYLLAAMIEQKSLFFLGTEAVLLSLLCLTSIRIGADLLFRRRIKEPTVVAPHFLKYGALDWSVIFGSAVALLVLGFFWQKILAGLADSAAAFLQ